MQGPALVQERHAHVHEGHALVQGAGFCALESLANNDDKVTLIVAAGGIPAVLAAMKAHMVY